MNLVQPDRFAERFVAEVSAEKYRLWSAEKYRAMVPMAAPGAMAAMRLGAITLKLVSELPYGTYGDIMVYILVYLMVSLIW